MRATVQPFPLVLSIFIVGKGGIWLLKKCWCCDRRDFLKQDFRGPDECMSQSHECESCFAMNDEQYNKQLEFTLAGDITRECTKESHSLKCDSASGSKAPCSAGSVPRKRHNH